MLKQLIQFDTELPDFFFDFDQKTIRDALMKALEDLSEAGDLIEVSRGKYKIVPTENIVEGIIDFTSSGSAYLMNEDFEDDIYISANHTGIALHGDHVKVSLFAHRPGSRMRGEVVEIVERAKIQFAGVVDKEERYAFLIPDNSKISVDFFIPPGNVNGAKHGDKAIVEITEWIEGAKNPTGRIVEVLGRPGENEAEMHAILIEYGFPSKFPEKIEKEAEKLASKISAKEIKSRRDFRDITTFTIDPVDAKDFDDALSIREVKKGIIEVGIHIADVSYYVKPGSALDTEAYNRATSVYLVDRVVPMLPEKLSNEVCSLRPKEEKLCFSAVFELNEDADVESEWFGRTVIYSDHRFSYEQAQDLIEGSKGKLKSEVLQLNDLAKKLREKRFEDGALAFNKQEVKFHLDDSGKPTGVYVKESGDSNKLIEEFMLLANKRVAELIGRKTQKGSRNAFLDKAKPAGEHTHVPSKTFVYRVHDIPSQDKLADFANFAKRFGHKFQTGGDRKTAHNLNKLMSKIVGTAEQNVLEQLAIRAMAKAVYTTENIGHYGLAFDHYTHFTSPIRRYPDILVHRLLQHYLDGGKSQKANDLEPMCKHSTEMEIRASEAERASVKYKQAEYLMDQLGEVFKGIISGVTEWGIFVELKESKCEGLIRLRSIPGDFYDFDERNFCIIGHRTKKKFQLGDEVEVMLAGVDLVKKQIDFELIDEDLHSSKHSFARKKRSGRRKY